MHILMLSTEILVLMVPCHYISLAISEEFFTV